MAENNDGHPKSLVDQIIDRMNSDSSLSKASGSKLDDVSTSDIPQVEPQKIDPQAKAPLATDSQTKIMSVSPDKQAPVRQGSKNLTVKSKSQSQEPAAQTNRHVVDPTRNGAVKEKKKEEKPQVPTETIPIMSASFPHDEKSLNSFLHNNGGEELKESVTDEVKPLPRKEEMSEEAATALHSQVSQSDAKHAVQDHSAPSANRMDTDSQTAVYSQSQLGGDYSDATVALPEQADYDFNAHDEYFIHHDDSEYEESEYDDPQTDGTDVVKASFREEEAPSKSKNWLPLALICGGVLAGVGGLALYNQQSAIPSAESSSTPSASATTPAPAPTPSVQMVKAADLQVGQCIENWQDKSDNSGDYSVVNCTTPHNAQVFYANGATDFGQAGYPGDDAINNSMQQMCSTQAAGATADGVDLNALGVQQYWTQPNSDSFNAGDRRGNCFFVSPQPTNTSIVKIAPASGAPAAPATPAAPTDSALPAAPADQTASAAPADQSQQQATDQGSQDNNQAPAQDDQAGSDQSGTDQNTDQQ